MVDQTALAAGHVERGAPNRSDQLGGEVVAVIPGGGVIAWVLGHDRQEKRALSVIARPRFQQQGMAEALAEAGLTGRAVGAIGTVATYRAMGTWGWKGSTRSSRRPWRTDHGHHVEQWLVR